MSDMQSKKKAASDNGLKAKDLNSFRKTLLLKRDELSRFQATQLNELGSPDKHHLADLEEMASDTETESLCEQIDIGSSTLEQIDLALEKIDAGTYGTCEECAESIPRARLEALPFAGLCVECQRKKELRSA